MSTEEKFGVSGWEDVEDVDLDKNPQTDTSTGEKFTVSGWEEDLDDTDLDKNPQKDMSTEAKFMVSGWEEDLEDIDLDKNPHETPEKEILWAAENGMLNKVKELIENNHDLIKVRDEDGYTPLHRACSGNHKEVVEYLLNQGANVSSTSELKWQPLHSTCQWNHKEISLMLIQRGANVNAVSEGLQTPLHISAAHGASYETAQLLLFHPYIKPTLKNNSGETAQDIAKRSSKYYNIFEVGDPLCDPILD